ncbi:hypothetical protein H8356DRAFT_341748 [Neocallimastix lanati (nom. inval.)]|nr:hypothetical protein H8356DRAFT_341748 [Neocallimastix sp. JGI-2020a]
MSFFGFDTSLPPLDKSELSKEKKSNVDQDLETFGLKENPILDDDEELNNETFGAAADVDKIDRNFDFTAGNSFFEKQIQGQDLGSKQLSGSSSFNNSSSSIDREQTFGIKNSNINKSASDMLNERIWNHYNSGNSNFSGNNCLNILYFLVNIEITIIFIIIYFILKKIWIIINIKLKS